MQQFRDGYLMATFLSFCSWHVGPSEAHPWASAALHRSCSPILRKQDVGGRILWRPKLPAIWPRMEELCGRQQSEGRRWMRLRIDGHREHPVQSANLAWRSSSFPCRWWRWPELWWSYRNWLDTCSSNVLSTCRNMFAAFSFGSLFSVICMMFLSHRASLIHHLFRDAGTHVYLQSMVRDSR